MCPNFKGNVCACIRGCDEALEPIRFHGVFDHFCFSVECGKDVEKIIRGGRASLAALVAKFNVALVSLLAPEEHELFHDELQLAHVQIQPETVREVISEAEIEQHIAVAARLPPVKAVPQAVFDAEYIDLLVLPSMARPVLTLLGIRMAKKKGMRALTRPEPDDLQRRTQAPRLAIRPRTGQWLNRA